MAVPCCVCGCRTSLLLCHCCCGGQPTAAEGGGGMCGGVERVSAAADPGGTRGPRLPARSSRPLCGEAVLERPRRPLAVKPHWSGPCLPPSLSLFSPTAPPARPLWKATVITISPRALHGLISTPTISHHELLQTSRVHDGEMSAWGADGSPAQAFSHRLLADFSLTLRGPRSRKKAFPSPTLVGGCVTVQFRSYTLRRAAHKVLMSLLEQSA